MEPNHILHYCYAAEAHSLGRRSLMNCRLQESLSMSSRAVLYHLLILCICSNDSKRWQYLMLYRDNPRDILPPPPQR